jgi:hypothetical protein
MKNCGLNRTPCRGHFTCAAMSNSIGKLTTGCSLSGKYTHLDAQSAEDDEGGEYAVSYKETAYEVLNFDLPEKGPVYTWLDQGAQELLDSWWYVFQGDPLHR